MESARAAAGITHTCEPLRRTALNHAFAAVYTCGVAALLHHHIRSLLHTQSLTSLALFLSDLVLAFMWLTAQAFRVRPKRRREFPENLKMAAGGTAGFPGLDVFVCTADPFKEPPLTLVNSVLSVMAYDYPSDRISVYVSDDGGSSLTLFALMEAAKFSKHWLPFCKNNNVLDRSPEAYFASDTRSWTDEAANIKEMYQKMKERVEKVVERGKVEEEYIGGECEHEAFSKWTDGFTSHHHPPIIQVLSENKKDKDVSGQMIPNLIYVSREKNRTKPTHFKAGALNTLLRVSATMTNAPVILTLDCDNYSNDPLTPIRALCYLLDPVISPTLGYVQFPQKFLGLNRNDIYGCEFKRMFEINPMGLDGLRGPDYFGSGCFFNRRSLFGGPSGFISPEIPEISPNFVIGRPITAQETVALAHHVAHCNYEDNTKWGSKIGFRYGSLVEDYFTGYLLQCEGWMSIFCNPKERAAFYGDAPTTLFDLLNQQKRWDIGLLEVSLSRYSTLTHGTKSVGLFMGLGYCHYSFSPFWTIPLSIYAFLPPFALLNGITIFPKISEKWFILYLFLFIGAYGQDLLDFILEGGTFQRWWNDQRMWTIRGVTCHLYGLIDYIFKSLGISTLDFNVTNKVAIAEQIEIYDREVMFFGVSTLMFVPMTMAAIINLLGFVREILRVIFLDGKFAFLEILLMGFVVVNCLPVYEGMILRKDKGRLPVKTTVLSVVLIWVLVVSTSFVFK